LIRGGADREGHAADDNYPSNEFLHIIPGSSSFIQRNQQPAGDDFNARKCTLMGNET